MKCKTDNGMQDKTMKCKMMKCKMLLSILFEFWLYMKQLCVNDSFISAKNIEAWWRGRRYILFSVDFFRRAMEF